MQLQLVTIAWTCRTNTLLIEKSIGLNISCIVVTKIWPEWTTFLIVDVIVKGVILHVNMVLPLEILVWEGQDG